MIKNKDSLKDNITFKQKILKILEKNNYIQI